ncbi:MAG: hypothetical protein WBP45_02245 [Daejeonella sp.]
MADRLVTIEAKLQKLIKTDIEYKVFGSNEPWDGHLYELIPPLEKTSINTLEEKMSVKLPVEYAEYITHIADGGAGPYYGLYNSWPASTKAVNYIQRYTNKDAEITEEFIEDEVLNNFTAYFKPFPISNQEINEFFEKIKSGKDPENEAFNIPDDFYGFLVLSEYGCGEYRILIITGEAAGTVWFFHADGKLYPCFKINNMGNYETCTFYDWYEEWLDESMQLVIKSD